MLDTSKTSQSTSAIGLLNETIKRGLADRQRMAQVLSTVRTVHLKLREDADAANAEVVRLKRALSASEAEKTRLAKRERDLAQEVSMMAAAIEVANREIAESDAMLLNTAVSVHADFAVEPTAPAAGMPEVKVSAVQPAPVRADAGQPRSAQPRAAHAQGRHDGPRKADARPSETLRLQPSSQPAPKMPEAAIGSLEENFVEIEKMLAESLKGTPE